MKHLVTATAVASSLGLLGCGKAKAKAPDLCVQAMEHVFTVMTLGWEEKLGPERAAKEKEEARRGTRMLTERCVADAWGSEAIQCVAASADRIALEACNAHLTEEQRARFLKAMGHPAPKPAEEEAGLDLQILVNEAFPLWAIANPDKPCPASIEELREHTSRGVVDPWGHPYRVLCGATLPAGAQYFAIASDGADGKPGTADDVRSW